MSVQDGNYKVQLTQGGTNYWLGIDPRFSGTENPVITQTDTNYIFYVKTDPNKIQRIFCLLPSGLPGELSVMSEEAYQIDITELNLSTPPSQQQIQFQPSNIVDNYGTQYTVNCPPLDSPLFSGGQNVCDKVTWTVIQQQGEKPTLAKPGNYVFKNQDGFLFLGYTNLPIVTVQKQFSPMSCTWTYDGTNIYTTCMGPQGIKYYIAVDSTGLNISIVTDRNMASKLAIYNFGSYSQIFVGPEAYLSVGTGINNNTAYGFSEYFPQSRFTIFQYAPNTSQLLPGGLYTIAYNGQYVNKALTSSGSYNVVFGNKPMSWLYDSDNKTLMDLDTKLCWNTDSICNVPDPTLDNCSHPSAKVFELTTDGKLFNTAFSSCYQGPITEGYTINREIRPAICDGNKWQFVRKSPSPRKSKLLLIVLPIIIVFVIVAIYLIRKKNL